MFATHFDRGEKILEHDQHQSGLIDNCDGDDYHSKCSHFEDDEDLAPSLVSIEGDDKRKKKQKMCCNDACYILWRTDFWKN